MPYKRLQNRILAIYIAFIAIIAIAIISNIAPAFTRGFTDGMNTGGEIAANWASGAHRSTYMLTDIPILQPNRTLQLEHLTLAPGDTVKAGIERLNLLVEQDIDDQATIASIAFSVLGNSPWIYLLVMLRLAACVAIIVLLGIILHSLRRSVREGEVFPQKNIRRTRIIGLLLILMEFCGTIPTWCMNRKAAEILASSELTVDTSFPISYWNLLTGLLVLFIAEIFAIGYQLSEEQKFTI